MRIGLGDIARVPQGWKPSQVSDCLPYSCGVQDPVAAQACTAGGAYTKYGAPSCLAPECSSFRSQIPNCGGQISGSGGTPTINPVVSTPAPVKDTPRPVTTETIQQPLPDLAGALLPSSKVQQKCSLWCDLNGSIDDNPVMSILILLGAAAILWPKGARR